MKEEEKYLYLSSGKGPAECEWVVMKLLQVISKCLQNSDLSFEIVDSQEGYNQDTYKSVQILVKGVKLTDHLSPWVGTIQWIGKSMYRKHHKRMNWFVRVDVLDRESKISIDDKDFEYMSYRASGPGGQHRNKVESAIKIVHKPTKIEAISSDSRSQYQNKVIARKRVISKIIQTGLDLKLQMINTKNQMNNGLIRGNPVRIFSGFKFKKT